MYLLLEFVVVDESGSLVETVGHRGEVARDHRDRLGVRLQAKRGSRIGKGLSFRVKGALQLLMNRYG